MYTELDRERFLKFVKSSHELPRPDEFIVVILDDGAFWIRYARKPQQHVGWTSPDTFYKYCKNEKELEVATRHLIARRARARETKKSLRGITA
jgi:hypothetical protein